MNNMIKLKVRIYNETIRDYVQSMSNCKQENRAVARKPRDAAAVLFSLKTEFNAKWRFKVIQSPVFNLESVERR